MNSEPKYSQEQIQALEDLDKAFNLLKNVDFSDYHILNREKRVELAILLAKNFSLIRIENNLENMMNNDSIRFSTELYKHE